MSHLPTTVAHVLPRRDDARPRLHNVRFAELHETFLVTAVATILVIRT
jgi:hypothetical protein